ncbi:tRNA dihydrouridine synthase DusB [Aerococcus sp. UMB10185]|uniref:tRNA dihydrouridine synthase DusB n=1 Tax=unclassified Aerococcus TaxID=2618060 RepID=UPI0008A4546B|nr:MULTISPECIES: tRNA dihydrouridine synthase DusB [unclassified Aerococcus]KAB0646388.1 tRNA dihydrouridine synthase DusB [Aerococcus sanguinicola]MDK6233712.1 tRNA dihydrouridine synthase DusB [Aerococcus sp. UMB10185]MDK6805589.1 tRNA dihydrouridine synthase DusB [Aerococcus sp. UMB7834]MDK6855933.1 tRNA dihydrouridine synthase DusB [Aerococcus sp. UMB7533]OFN03757.1 tRNA-dihydrouridine synthase [Aerococcus sp. HMSC062A02]
MIKIGNIDIANPIAVAPMAGISNAAFRVMVKEMGAGLVVCEMISDQGIHYRNKKTLSMLHIEESEWPLSVQIFGGSEESLAEAARFVQDNTKAAIIDINMGCPVNKVVKTDAGARCLLDPEEVHGRVKAVVDAVDLPVSVKMRTGWDADHILAKENARAAQEAGVSMIAMHGRTREQMYRGHADWDIIAEVAQELTVPFYGNGDIRTPEEAKAALDNYGVDGVMVGRACLGDPFIIQRMVHYLETGELLPEKKGSERIDEALDHLRRLVDLKGEVIGVKEFRGLVSYYLKGISRASKVKLACTQADTYDEVVGLLSQFQEQVLEREAKEGR